MPAEGTMVEYFGKGTPAASPTQVTGLFQKTFRDFQRGAGGELLTYPAALSRLIQAAATPTPSQKVSPEARGYVGMYQKLLKDFVALMKLPDTREAVSEKAAFNQRLAQDFWTSGQPGQENARRAAEFFVQTAIVLKQAGTRLGEIAVPLLSGARSQAALMRFLQDDGWKILVPATASPKEIDRWDVTGGVDFAAVSGDGSRILLVDTKGRARYETGGVFLGERVVTEVNPNPPRPDSTRAQAQKAVHHDIANYVAQRGDRDWAVKLQRASVHPVQMVLPTTTSFLSASGTIHNESAKIDIRKGIQTLRK